MLKPVRTKLTRLTSTRILPTPAQRNAYHEVTYNVPLTYVQRRILLGLAGQVLAERQLYRIGSTVRLY